MSTALDMSVSRAPSGAIVVHLEGELRGAACLIVPEDVADDVEGAHRIEFDTSQLDHWDTALLVWIRHLLASAETRGAEVDTSGLPDGVRRMIALSYAVPPEPPPEEEDTPFVARVGLHGLGWWASCVAVLSFLGEMAYSVARLVTGRARMRRRDLYAELAAAGVRSLSIVAVVSFLLGMILAFVGGVTLRSFGASIYVADVVTISMLRELGAVMTAIVMAGRTGSAYAAQLGTMKVTQEIDALTTMALPATDFLVLPRVLALSLMLPLLTIYSDFVAIVGGGVVAVATGSGVAAYAHEVQVSATLTIFWIGVVKSAVFGVVVAVCGCVEGLRANGGAQSVGDAATNAVVTSIIWIIALDGVFAIVLEVLKL